MGEFIVHTVLPSSRNIRQDESIVKCKCYRRIVSLGPTWQIQIIRLRVRLCTNTGKGTDHLSGRSIHDQASVKTNYHDNS